MLFNSYEFIFAFLPITLLGFFVAVRRLGKEAGLAWLVAASLFFYSWWNPKYLLLILFSMLFNYAAGRALTNSRNRNKLGKRTLLALGISVNLGMLGYYKYANFFVENVNLLAGTDYQIGVIVLPLAISFFTFQQIAYLVDAYQGITKEYDFLHYALFVTFFPQLIAGPIVHHKEMLPQFMGKRLRRIDPMDLAVGLTIFFIGLFKKTVLADGVARYATPVFSSASAGEALTFFEAWGGALAYTMQLYFDFSGYSDMAIGAARLFGIHLPLNFHSPYKATSITEFWRRWHMTLSRFLRDYLYIPLGGNRKGQVRRYINLILTMLLGGLWHGAGWTFVIWGALHGLYLATNQIWRSIKAGLGFGSGKPGAVRKGLAWLITFLAVVAGWVFFRAEDFGTAMVMFEGMGGLNGVAVPNAIGVRLGTLGEVLKSWGVVFSLGGGGEFALTWLWIAGLAPIAFLFPNTQELMERFKPALSMPRRSDDDAIEPASFLASRLYWAPNSGWAVTIALVSALGILALSEISEFLYFQF